VRKVEHWHARKGPAGGKATDVLFEGGQEGGLRKAEHWHAQRGFASRQTLCKQGMATPGGWHRNKPHMLSGAASRRTWTRVCQVATPMGVRTGRSAQCGLCACQARPWAFASN